MTPGTQRSLLPLVHRRPGMRRLSIQDTCLVHQHQEPGLCRPGPELERLQQGGSVETLREASEQLS